MKNMERKGYNIMKKLLALILVMGAFLMSTGCTTTKEPTPKSEPQTYTAYGRYYTDGTVITNDGDEWGYTADTISDLTPADNMPVWIAFNDNGTPDDITDDVILGLVYDRNTAIYDELAQALGDSFEIERDGNNIKIITNKESTSSGTLYTFADGTGYYVEY